VAHHLLRGGVHLKAYRSVSEAKASLGQYLKFSNARRPHSRLDLPPDRVHFNQLPLSQAA
jgi:putative transposase